MLRYQKAEGSGSYMMWESGPFLFCLLRSSGCLLSSYEGDRLLVTMTKSALGPRLGFRGYPKVNTLGVKCFWRKVYATLGVSCYLFFSCWFDSVELVRWCRMFSIYKGCSCSIVSNSSFWPISLFAGVEPDLFGGVERRIRLFFCNQLFLTPYIY